MAASDYSQNSGTICGAPAGPITTSIELGSDPALALSNGRAFYLARDKDLLFELDPACATPIAPPTSVGDLAPAPVSGAKRTADPQDAAAAPDGTVWVPLWATPCIAVLRDGAAECAIDTSSYDADGNPQAASIRIVDVGGSAKAFVALDRLDDSKLTPNDVYASSTQSAQMLRIDVTTRTVEAVIDLAGRDPFNAMAEYAGALFLAEPRSFDAADEDLAGIERFDTQTGATALLVTERAIGASVAEVAVTDHCGAAIVAGPEHAVNPTSLITFDPDTGEIVTGIDAPLLATDDYTLQGLAWRGNTLYVGDRRDAQGGYIVHVFERDPGTCNIQLSTRAITLPQKPIALRPAQYP